MKTIILILVLLLVGCSDNDQLLQDFKSNSAEYIEVVEDINDNRIVYASQFKSKLVDSSFILDGKMMTEPLFSKSLISQFIKKKENIKITVLSDSSIWFTEIANDGKFTSKNNVLIYSHHKIDQIDAKLNSHYPTVEYLQQLKKKWFFAKTRSSID